MDLTLLYWTRTQFMVSVGFLAFFLAISLGLAWMLLFFRWRAQRTAQVAWLSAYRFWVRVFALSFVLAVCAALIVLFQLGGLWGGLMDRIGNVAGPLLGYAVISLFIFKSCFLGIMLFGQRRVSERMHVFAVAMVAVGQTVAVSWVVVLQAWLATPTGARLFENRFQVYDWTAVVLNPALGWHLASVVVGSALAVGCLILGLTANQARRRKLEEGERLAFQSALVLTVLAALLHIPVAAWAIDAAVKHQPAKAAAMAGFWETGPSPAIVVLGWPKASEERNVAAWSWRNAGGALLARNAQGEYLGLDSFSGMRPPMPLTFLTWRAVALLWLAVLVLAVITLLRVRKRQFDPAVLSGPTLQMLSACMVIGALLATLRTWAEFMGLSPYVVQGLVTQAEVLGPMHASSVMWGTFGYLTLYALLAAAFFAMVFHAARYGVVPVRRVGRVG